MIYISGENKTPTSNAMNRKGEFLYPPSKSKKSFFLSQKKCTCHKALCQTCKTSFNKLMLKEMENNYSLFENTELFSNQGLINFLNSIKLTLCLLNNKEIFYNEKDLKKLLFDYSIAKEYIPIKLKVPCTDFQNIKKKQSDLLEYINKSLNNNSINEDLLQEDQKKEDLLQEDQKKFNKFIELIPEKCLWVGENSLVRQISTHFNFLNDIYKDLVNLKNNKEINEEEIILSLVNKILISTGQENRIKGSYDKTMNNFIVDYNLGMYNLLKVYLNLLEFYEKDKKNDLNVKELVESMFFLSDVTQEKISDTQEKISEIDKIQKHFCEHFYKNATDKKIQENATDKKI